MTYFRENKGVCSRSTKVVIENNIVKSIEVDGGCNGNLSGIARLVIGMNANYVIDKIKGTTCGRRNTSCPDQIALCIEEALAQ